MGNFSVKNYWESRYKSGGNSGWGSHDASSVNFKKDYINTWINEFKTKTIVELGCGDGNQLSYFDNYDKYYGYDISPNIIEKNKVKFKGDDTKEFESDIDKLLLNKYDLALSLDVIYHLVEEDVFETYMHNLFKLSDKVCIFATDVEEPIKVPHIRHRKINDFITKHYPNYKLTDVKMFEETIVGFFLYEKQ
jgi:SAM-dependent methyltransferase